MWWYLEIGFLGGESGRQNPHETPESSYKTAVFLGDELLPDTESQQILDLLTS